MTFLIETSAGDILGYGNDEAEAVAQAKALLSDDPELGQLDIYRSEHLATVTHGPTANWETEIVVLKPGEKIEPPHGWPVPARMPDDEFDELVNEVYGDDWGKAEGMRQARERGEV